MAQTSTPGTPAPAFDETAAIAKLLDAEGTPRNSRRGAAPSNEDDEGTDPATDLGDLGDEYEEEPEDDTGDPAEQRDDDAPNDEDDLADDDPTVLGKKVRVVVDGEEQAITVDELRRGYQRHADYSRKTEQLAQTRTQFEAGVQSLVQRHEALDQGLQQLSAAIVAQQPQRLNPQEMEQLYQVNPLEFVRLQAQYAKTDADLAEIENCRAQQSAAARQAWGTQMLTRVAGETEKLLKLHPEWREPAKGSAARQALVDYATSSYGFSPAELGTVLDHRHLDILDKARKWDAAVARTKGQRGNRPLADAAPQQRQPARTAAPGTAPLAAGNSRRTRSVQAQQRLAKTGRIDDAAAAIEALL